VIPHFGDQDFWAKEIIRLGAGIRLSKKHWPERLYKAVQKVRSDLHYAEHARFCADQLSKESGSSHAVSVLESFVKGK
jgi:UDP:flavonoid glycosyltransferase YjiC (YdhE family)